MTNQKITSPVKKIKQKKTYAEKLRDPRWQKKRLEVLERDDWACQSCGDSKTTLHVHHKKYNKNPWNADLEDMETLCEKCHERVSTEIKEFDLLIKKVKGENLYLDEISGFILGLQLYDNPHQKIKIKNYEMAIGVARVFCLGAGLIISNMTGEYISGADIANAILTQQEYNFNIDESWAKGVIDGE